MTINSYRNWETCWETEGHKVISWMIPSHWCKCGDNHINGRSQPCLHTWATIPSVPEFELETIIPLQSYLCKRPIVLTKKIEICCTFCRFKSSHWDTYTCCINMSADLFTHKPSPEMSRIWALCSLIIFAVIFGAIFVHVGNLNFAEVCEKKNIHRIRSCISN